MVACTIAVARRYLSLPGASRACSIAARNADITLPSSATVVPAMSRHATLILDIHAPQLRPSGSRNAARGERLLGDRRGKRHTTPAWTGDQHHGWRDLSPEVQARTGHLAVYAGPPPPRRRQRRPEQLLSPGAQVIIGRLIQVEGERLVVGVRVADREAAIKPLCQQQLRAGGRGNRTLRCEPGPAGQVVGQ